MADISTFLKTIGRGGFPALGSKVGVIQNDISFASTNVVATNNVKVFSVPAGTVVLAIGIQVETAEGTTCTADLGDSGSATRFLSNCNLNSVANSMAAATVLPYLYGSALTIDLYMDHNASTAVIRVWALVADLADLLG
jgi:hypothetical protein